MEIILRKQVTGLGSIGDRVKVADGYARNYLIPKGFAVIASKKAMAVIAREKNLEKVRQERDRQKAEELAKKIKKISCTIVKQVGEGDRLFGSVTANDIVKSLENQPPMHVGFDIDDTVLFSSPGYYYGKQKTISLRNKPEADTVHLNERTTRVVRVKINTNTHNIEEAATKRKS